MQFRPTTVAAAAGLAALAAAAPAHALTATVQVEGKTEVLPPTAVTVPTGPVKSCPSGGNAAAALDAAVNGDWNDPGGYVDRIRTETLAFGSGAYWSLYVNGRYDNDGICGRTLAEGDEVVFYAAEDPFTPGQGGYGEPLRAVAPAGATAGAPFAVEVQEPTTVFDSNFAGTTTLAPSEGATVAGGGATATTGADGRATLTLPAAGDVPVVVTKGDRAPDRFVVRVVAPGTPVPPQPGVPCKTTGQDGFCGTPDREAGFAKLRSIAEGQRFASGKGPRELAGVVEGEAALERVRLRLTGNDRGRCRTFSATREELVRIRRCGATRGQWFTVGANADFRYLLPERLGRGRWVLDVETRDRAGNVNDTLQRGRTRVVFTVR